MWIDQSLMTTKLICLASSKQMHALTNQFFYKGTEESSKHDQTTVNSWNCHTVI